MAPRGKQHAEVIQSSDEDEQEIPHNEPKPNAQFTALEAELRAFKTAQETRADNLESMIRQLLARLPNTNTNTSTPETTFNPDKPIPSTEHSTLRSKKLPDSTPLSDGIEPTFEAWSLLIEGKLLANADYYPTEAHRMIYVFNCTTGNAQKHLLPRYAKDSTTRFATADEMIQHLALIYINPHKVRDARYAYNRLMMRTGQTFADFQTTFLHLAGESQTPRENLRMDLYDKLITPMQDRLMTIITDLVTYEQLVDRCLTIDAELRRVNARTSRQKRLQVAPENTTTLPARPPFFTPGATRTNTPAGPQPRQTMSIAPRQVSVVPDKPVTCFNCKEPGHWANACPATPRKLAIADIEEQPEPTDEDESGKEDA
jgi:hypothetical protein